jgi:hypothetical protein
VTRPEEVCLTTEQAPLQKPHPPRAP